MIFARRGRSPRKGRGARNRRSVRRRARTPAALRDNRWLWLPRRIRRSGAKSRSVDMPSEPRPNGLICCGQLHGRLDCAVGRVVLPPGRAPGVLRVPARRLRPARRYGCVRRVRRRPALPHSASAPAPASASSSASPSPAPAHSRTPSVSPSLPRHGRRHSRGRARGHGGSRPRISRHRGIQLTGPTARSSCVCLPSPHHLAACSHLVRSSE